MYFYYYYCSLKTKKIRRVAIKFRDYLTAWLNEKNKHCWRRGVSGGVKCVKKRNKSTDKFLSTSIYYKTIKICFFSYYNTHGICVSDAVDNFGDELLCGLCEFYDDTADDGCVCRDMMWLLMKNVTRFEFFFPRAKWNEWWDDMRKANKKDIHNQKRWSTNAWILSIKNFINENILGCYVYQDVKAEKQKLLAEC